MPGSFHGIHMASSALRAFQRAMETSGNNLANVNTPGYSRQRVNLQTLTPVTVWSNGASQLGAGVSVANITRSREMFLEQRFQQAQSSFSQYGQYMSSLQQIEGVYQEPGPTGIANALDQMFSAFSGLASNPTDLQARVRVRDAGSTLAARIRGAYAELNTLRDNAEVQITETFQRVNDLSNRLATLNSQIRGAQLQGGHPNQLLDDRDSLIRELSTLVNITTVPQSDGTMNIFMSNRPLVVGNDATAIPTTYDPVAQTLTDGTNTFPVRGGELLGHFMTIQRIDRSQGELDQLANALRTQFNSIHQTGINGNGATGINFFNDATPPATQTGAIDFNLSAEVLASPQGIAVGTTAAGADNSVALALARLRETSVGSLGNQTIAAFYRGHIGAIAQEIGTYRSQTDTFGAILDQVQAQVESVSGVNMDEEMTDMMRFQRSYQAAARVLTILDQTTEDLINMVRR